jgi:hypothetical protein
LIDAVRNLSIISLADTETAIAPRGRAREWLKSNIIPSYIIFLESVIRVQFNKNGADGDDDH